MMDRRSLIIGGACLIAAPAIVKFEWLMPVKKVIEPRIQDVLAEMTLEELQEYAMSSWDTSSIYDPVLRDLVRRRAPALIARDICGGIGPKGSWIGLV